MKLDDNSRSGFRNKELMMTTVISCFKKSILLLMVALTLCGCDYKMKQSIKAYQGDGEIRYLESPGLLGRSGCDVKMPSFDLSKSFHAEYNLSGLPDAKAEYVVYLVVYGAYYDEIPVRYNLKIFKDGREVKNLSSKVKKVTNAYGGSYDRKHRSGMGDNRFYFFAYENDLEGSYIKVSEKDSKWSLIVSCENEHLSEPVEAYILISAGGFK
jgi:hypothetical protein